MPYLFFLFSALLVLCAACSPSDPQNTLFTVGEVARKQQNLFWIIFAWAAGVFFVVEGLLLFTVVKFRRRPNSPEPAQVHGNTRLELAWTIAPNLVLASIGVPTISTIFELAETPAVAMRVTVTGHQWWWEFEYPDLGVLTANELHLPQGEAIDLTLESADVIHSFWVPKLAGKTDAIPQGHRRMWLRGDAVGEYFGQCAELCGVQHANMRFRVFVDSRDEFNNWVRAQRTPPSAPSGDAARGQEVFLKPANQCIACHTIEGAPGAAGKTGPNLTHVGLRTTIAAVSEKNTPEGLTRWLKDPNAVKQGNIMGERFKQADIHLSDQDISALIAYFQSLK